MWPRQTLQKVQSERNCRLSFPRGKRKNPRLPVFGERRYQTENVTPRKISKWQQVP